MVEFGELAEFGESAGSGLVFVPESNEISVCNADTQHSLGFNPRLQDKATIVAEGDTQPA